MHRIHRHFTLLCIASQLFFFQQGLFGSVGFSIPDTTKAHLFYESAVEKYEEGDLQEAADMFGEAARLFTKKKKWKRVIDCRLFVTKARSLNADEEGLRDYCMATLELSNEKLGKNHPSTGDCQNRLGELYYYDHKNELARSCFDIALNIYSLDGDPDSLAMAKVYSNIGGLKMNLAEYDSAKVYVQKALDIQLGLLDSLDMKLLPTYNTMGALNYYLGNMDQAICNFEKTLQIRLNKFGANHHEVASSFNNLGSAYENKKEFQKAVDLHQDALNIRRTTLDSLHPNIALSLNNLANAWYGLGDYEKSNEYHSEALRIRKKIYGDNHRDIAMSYANIGHNLVLQDNPAEATYYFRKVVPIMINLYGPDHLLTSDAYENLGLPFYYSGAYDSAFYYMFKALRIREKIQNGINGSIARSYNNIGALYKDNGDYELALSYYKKSAEVHETLLGENCNPLAGSFNNMGEVYLETGEYEKSYDYFRRSLDIDMANLGPENPRLASRYLNLGAVAAEMGKHAESVEYNKQALHLHLGAYGENNRLTSSIYGNMAMDYVAMDSLDMALNYLKRAIEILKDFYGKNHFYLSTYYTQVGQLLVETGEITLARDNLYHGLAVNYSGEIDPEHLENTDTEKIIDKNQFIESLVAITKYNESVLAANERSEFLAGNLIIYQLIADISIKLREMYSLERSKLQALKKWDYLYSEAFKTAAGLYELSGEELYFDKAFHFAGLKKASALMDAILMSQAMENSGIPDSIIQLEKTLQARLEGHKQNLFELDTTAGAGDKKVSIENEINAITIRLNELYLDIERTYPEYNNLRSRYPRYMPEEIGSKLDPKTLLLDFIISDSTIYTIVISHNDHWIEKIEVPADFASRVNHLLRAVKKYRVDDFMATSKEIYRTLLRPLEKYFTGIEKIVFIPDDYLLLLPFDILISKEDPENSDDLASQDYFIKRFETVLHYSTDLWIRSKRVNQTAIRADSSISGFIGFAPVFHNYQDNAETLLAASALAASDTSYTHRSVVDRMSLQELPYSLHEVNELAAMFAKNGEPATAILHADASEKNFREKSANYKYIHVATHGLINPEKPELSGLVFWKDQSDQKEENPQLLIAEKENDGVLYTKEMYSLRLTADLVTLSACETGAGQLVKGEGLLSFVRGFTYAGVPNVLISYWKVNDKTTADFMFHFYSGVLSGYPYATALRKAKLAAISNISTAFPASWGTFVLIGN
ncbi:MAG: CHAT domain-containing tetratricopeptide repeat protein [Bacteroidota bacterium]|nr:CHAT domain-containing tetratricopeptide repeat protein [Bacteroidota bacterium]